ncbi:hypothetical protein [Streptomyces noursei]|uniref:hypothetical protein n=1 Tax=Streptomyces noursei TaxID=1971 RepID=UPI003819D18F
MHEHAGRGQTAPGLEQELTEVLEAEGIPLAHVLDDPDGNGTIVLTNGVTLLTDGEGTVIVTALAHDGYSTVPGTAVEEAICGRARQTLERLGYPLTPHTMTDNTLRVRTRPARG